jgi:hypothetical protein
LIDREFIERMALEILDAEGIEAIWSLNLAAAQAHRAGLLTAAAIFILMAWLMRLNARTGHS